MNWYGFPAPFGADFNADRSHRLLLWRLWSPEPGSLLGFVMLNPSSADETRDDPTTVRNMARARALGYAGVVQANLYSYRTPHPRLLKAAGYPGHPVASDNTDALARLGDLCPEIVLAWGAHARPGDAAALLRLLALRPRPPRLRHLGLLKNGQPRHPLHTAYAVPLQE